MSSYAKLNRLGNHYKCSKSVIGIYVIQNQEVLTTFFLILIFAELIKFKTSDERQHRKTGIPTLGVEVHQPLAYVVIQTPLLSL